MSFKFRKAVKADVSAVWTILQQAIQLRKEADSNQWQDGYPNETIVEIDIEKKFGYVLLQDEVIVGYCAILVNDEPEYDKIIGKWLTNGDFIVYHRVAIAKKYLGKGLARKMLDFIEIVARENSIYSLKADTNYDNHAMLALFKKAGYSYCGEVFFRGSARQAFEKVLLR